MTAEITVILVSWKDAGELEAAVESLVAARRRILPGGPRVSLIVVDNGNGGLARGGILSLWPGASIIVNEANRGFGPAANQAAEIAPGDVLLFLNPDTRAEGEPFSEIARGLEANPGAVALAPRLLDLEGGGSKTGQRLAPPDREDQFTFQLRRLPDLASDARELLLIDHLVPNNSGRRRDRYADRNRDVPFEVEQAAAAALAVRKDRFRRIGGFDERFVPAWFEDVDLCARLGREGTILYWPKARFRHRGRLSSETLGYALFLPVYYRNALQYRKRYYPMAARLAYRILLALGMLLRLAAIPFRRRMPRSRAEAAQAYGRVLSIALGLSSAVAAEPLAKP